MNKTIINLSEFAIALLVGYSATYYFMPDPNFIRGFVLSLIIYILYKIL